MYFSRIIYLLVCYFVQFLSVLNEGLFNQGVLLFGSMSQANKTYHLENLIKLVKLGLEHVGAICVQKHLSSAPASKQQMGRLKCHLRWF